MNPDEKTLVEKLLDNRAERRETEERLRQVLTDAIAPFGFKVEAVSDNRHGLFLHYELTLSASREPRENDR